MRVKIGLLPLLCVLLFHVSACASILIVPDEVSTIEDAIAAAVPHDTVLVRAGDHEIERTIEFLVPHVTLMAEAPWDSRVLANNPDLLMKIEADSCRVQDLVMIMLVSGQAINISGPSGAPGVITGTCIHGNVIAGFASGGIYDRGRSGTRITENVFNGLMGAIRSLSQDPVIAMNEIVECGYWAIHLSGGGLVVDNECHDNWMVSDFGSPGRGGGITIVNNDYPIEIVGNRIFHNRTDGWAPEEGLGMGGGIYLEGASDVTISNNEIWANQALKGAGLYAEASDFLLEGNLFWANRDSTFFPENPQRGYGGSIYALNCSGTISQNTCVHNTALIDGAAVFIENSPNIEFTSNVFAQNAGDGGGVSVVGAAPIQFECNDVWFNGSVNFSGWDDPTGTNGNISADPVFCYPDTGNYHIRDDSPCASDNSPGGCGLIGRYDVGCGLAGIGQHVPPHRDSALRVVPNPVFSGGAIHLEVLWPNHHGRQRTTFWIVDCAGRVLASVPAQEDSRGVAIAEWDGIAHNGNPAPSGVYYVRVESGRATLGARLLVIR
jgi:Right handed beta helix region/FlgD Ig-like domain